MREAVLADAGPLYAAVDPTDSHHQRARRELQRLSDDRCDVFVPFSILLETHSLLLRKLGRSIALRWVHEMADAALINPTSEDYRAASAKLADFRDQSISMFDATVAILALRTGLPVWTYDHHFDVMRVPVWR